MAGFDARDQEAVDLLEKAKAQYEVYAELAAPHIIRPDDDYELGGLRVNSDVPLTLVVHR